MSARTRVGLATAAVATLGLVGGGLAPAATGVTSARLAPTPKLDITVTKTGHTVQGPKTFRAGRVSLKLTVRKSYATAGIVKLKSGYTLKAAEADLFSAFGPVPDLDRLMKFNNKTTFFGGLAGGRGTVLTGTVVLPRGTFIMYDFGGEHIKKLATLKVTGPAVKRAAPQSDGRIVARAGSRWGGSKTIPHQGTLTFKNDADQPHFLEVQHVAAGTTRAEVLDCLGSDDPNCFDGFAREGSLSLEVLDPGKSMTVDHDLPRGYYVLMCFYPDHMTGAPHAAMGMVKIIKLT